MDFSKVIKKNQGLQKNSWSNKKAKILGTPRSGKLPKVTLLFTVAPAPAVTSSLTASWRLTSKKHEALHHLYSSPRLWIQTFTISLHYRDRSRSVCIYGRSCPVCLAVPLLARLRIGVSKASPRLIFTAHVALTSNGRHASVTVVRRTIVVRVYRSLSTIRRDAL